MVTSQICLSVVCCRRDKKSKKIQQDDSARRLYHSQRGGFDEEAYSINTTTLEWVDTFKYLGVTINNKLIWGDHITEVTARASPILNLLRRTTRDCHRDAKT